MSKENDPIRNIANNTVTKIAKDYHTPVIVILPEAERGKQTRVFYAGQEGTLIYGVIDTLDHMLSEMSLSSDDVRYFKHVLDDLCDDIREEKLYQEEQRQDSRSGFRA